MCGLAKKGTEEFKIVDGGKAAEWLQNVLLELEHSKGREDTKGPAGNSANNGHLENVSPG